MARVKKKCVLGRADFELKTPDTGDQKLPIILLDTI
jgi:hypothetical protein